jgi:hypothetical protein
MSKVIINAGCPILVAPGEHPSLMRAAEILAGDIERIVGRRPHVGSGPLTPLSGGRILICTATNAEARPYLTARSLDTTPMEGLWEAYLHAIAGGDVVICGADPMGTLRGVYAFCRDRLGTDPWIRWTGIAPDPKPSIELQWDEPVRVPSPTFRFRGWFLNNAHLINWNSGKGPVAEFKAKHAGKVDSGLAGAFGPQTAAMVAETCLRLEMNFIIPLSCWNIAEPHEKEVADVCAAFGLYLSFHHLEPVGANLRDWSEFWTARGEAVPEMSFGRHPDKFEIWWKHWIDLWARYDRVIWTLGHRGPGDRRYWIADPHDPGNDPARGRAIAEAMRMQVRLIRQAVGDREVVTCATLWQEGSELHAADLLEFPEKTMVIMADHGAKQMMRDDFYFTRRRDALQYGVYYHACYGPGGPHWAQSTNPAKMWFNLRQLIARRETAIALLNTGSIRTYMVGIDAFSRITTCGGQGFQPEQFLVDWCARAYGDALADAAAEAYSCFFYAMVAPWHPGYDGSRSFWDTLLQCELHVMFKLIYHRDVEAAHAREGTVFATAAEYLRMHRNACAGGLAAWDAVCERAHRLEPLLEGARRDLLLGNLSCQSELMRGLFYGTWHVSRAALAMHEGNEAVCVAELKRARERVRVGLQYWADNGNRAPFHNWIRSPHVIAGKGGSTLHLLDDLLLALEGTSLPAADSRRLEEVFRIRTPEKWK